MEIPSKKKNYNDINVWLNSYFSLIVVAILIIFIGAAYGLVLAPRFSLTKQILKTSIQNEEILYASSQKKLYTLQDIDRIYQNIKPGDLQKFNSVLPSAYVPDRLYGELGEIVTSGGWSLNSVKFASAKNKADLVKTATSTILTNTSKYPGLAQYDITLAVSSIDYGGLKTLLHLLENNLRLMDVTKLNFLSDKDMATIGLRTYYYNAQ